MAHNDFKQEFWSAHIQTELEKNTILDKFCNHEFEGEIAKGAKLKILGVQRPVISNYTGNSQTAEKPTTSGIYLYVDIAKNYFITVDDLDAAQSKPGLLEAYTEEGNKGLGEERDTAIAALAASAKTMSTATAAVDTEAEAMALIDAAFEDLYDNGVKNTDDLELALPPFMYTLVRKQIVSDLTENVKVVRRGLVGMMNNAQVVMTNNLYVDASGYSYAMLRTKKAIAFAGQLHSVEPTRLAPTGIAADAILAVDAFGTRIVRQNELYVIRAKKSA